MSISFVFRATSALLAVAGVAGQVRAEPTGAVVVAGAASLIGAGPIVIKQTSPKAIINWRSFSVGAGESVRFEQPSAGSLSLNRVVGGQVSRIDGQVQANGQVILVNPDGVTFGGGAKVDVNGLIATTSNIANADFMAGRLVFGGTSPNTTAGVTNQGAITAGRGGYVVLSATTVDNSGLISARVGSVTLGAGRGFTLDFTGDGLLTYQITTPEGSSKQAGGLAISHSGLIDAPGGKVLLTANAARAVTAGAINIGGVVRATGIHRDGGTIVIDGGNGGSNTPDDGRVTLGGTLAAGSGMGVGGTISVLGGNVSVASGAKIDVSAPKGGGAVLVGGDQRGRGGTPISQRVSVAAGAKIIADATTNGAGGTVVTYSLGSTDFSGFISARGGPSGGTGGWVEVSGKSTLAFNGSVDTSAVGGTRGKLLLDPSDITIGATSAGVTGSTTISGTSPTSMLSVATLNTLLAANDVTVDAGGGVAAGTGTIKVSSTIAPAAGSVGGLTLKALANITIGAPITLPVGNLTLTSATGGIGVFANISLSNSATLTALANGATTAGAGYTVSGTQAGIYVQPGATIAAPGGMTMSSTISSGGAQQNAIWIKGVLSTISGPLSLTGTSSTLGSATTVSHGVVIDGGSTSLDGGTLMSSAAIILAGTASGAVGTSGSGVVFSNAGKAIATGSAPLNVTGSSDGGAGVDVLAGFGLSTEAGLLSLNGEATNGASGGVGVRVWSPLSTITGAVSVNGSVQGAAQWGVEVTAPITATAPSGAIAITGTTSGSGTGVFLASASTISAAGGAITVSGTSGGGGGLVGRGAINDSGTGGAGTISLSGVGATGKTGIDFANSAIIGNATNGVTSISGSAALGTGVALQGPAITVANGDLTIAGSGTTGVATSSATIQSTGTADVSLTAPMGTLSLQNATVKTTNGGVSLGSDKLSISGATISSGAGVTIAPVTAGTPIQVGSTLGTGLVVTPAALMAVAQAQLLTIGSLTSGAVNLIGDPSTVPLSVISGAAVTNSGNVQTKSIVQNGTVAPPPPVTAPPPPPVIAPPPPPPVTAPPPPPPVIAPPPPPPVTAPPPPSASSPPYVTPSVTPASPTGAQSANEGVADQTEITLVALSAASSAQSSGLAASGGVLTGLGSISIASVTKFPKVPDAASGSAAAALGAQDGTQLVGQASATLGEVGLEGGSAPPGAIGSGLSPIEPVSTVLVPGALVFQPQRDLPIGALSAGVDDDMPILGDASRW